MIDKLPVPVIVVVPSPASEIVSDKPPVPVIVIVSVPVRLTVSDRLFVPVNVNVPVPVIAPPLINVLVPVSAMLVGCHDDMAPTLIGYVGAPPCAYPSGIDAVRAYRFASLLMFGL
jgi:hypothetical protein